MLLIFPKIYNLINTILKIIAEYKLFLVLINFNQF